MRGDWNDLNRRLVSALIALDADDSLIIGDVVEEPKRGRFGRAARKGPDVAPAPRRWVQITATRGSLVGEVVGSTRFGGEWPMSAETEAEMTRMGWAEPWSDKWRTFNREMPLQNAPRMALAVVRALQALGCEMETIDVEHRREEPEG